MKIAARLRPRLAGVALSVGVVGVAGVAGGCTTSRHTSDTTTSRPAPSTTVPPTTIVPLLQVGGSVTVLSPVGLNVRKSPGTSAPIVGTAAQGVVFKVLGTTSNDGGWLNVKGATVTGWITSQPTLTAPGTFHHYSGSEFSVLYPSTWTESSLAAPSSTPTTSGPTTSVPTGTTSTSVAATAQSGVVFQPASHSSQFTVIAAGSVSQLPHGRAGYSVKSVSSILACGITAGLVVFQKTGATPPGTSPPASTPASLAYLVEARFAVDKQHALGFYADTPDLGPTFQLFKNLISSVTFNAPQCAG